jgi:phosphoribosylformylglycinamidine synthase
VLTDVIKADARFLWHKDHDLTGLDLIVLPGGFSYGDYLRCGAIAKFSPIMSAVTEFAEKGGLVVGICNGFQVLTESGLLPGALIRNKGLKFICKQVNLRVENNNTHFTSQYAQNEVIQLPIAHGEGCYMVDDATWAGMKDQVLFRYCDQDGELTEESNPNGARDHVAGIIPKAGNVLGMMPHPERCAEELMQTQDGYKLFASIKNFLR